MVEIRRVLQVIVARTWNVFLQVLVNLVRFGVHVNLRTFTDRRRDWVLSGSRHLVVAPSHHAGTLLSPDLPASSFVFHLGVVRLVLARGRLEFGRLFKL